MTLFRIHGNGRLTTEQVSMRVLYVLVALSVLVFGAFFLIGYDTPYEDDPTFNAPVLTDVVLVFMYVLVAVALVVACVSAIHGFKVGDKSQSAADNVPSAWIVWGTAALLVVSMAVTFLFGSGEPVVVNGVKFTDTFWLKITDMFINTSFVLLFVAVCGVVFGLSGYNRKVRLKVRDRR